MHEPARRFSTHHAYTNNHTGELTALMSMNADDDEITAPVAVIKDKKKTHRGADATAEEEDEWGGEEEGEGTPVSIPQVRVPVCVFLFVGVFLCVGVCVGGCVCVCKQKCAKQRIEELRLMLEEAMGFERFYSAYTYMKEVCVRGREGESARERVRE